MSSGINLIAIYIANGMGILLAMETIFGSDWKNRRRKKEYAVIRTLLVISVISCFVSPLCFTMDGKPGKLPWFIIYIGNIWLYVGNMLIGPGWVQVIYTHGQKKMPKSQKILVNSLCLIGTLGLLINFFKPVVYSVSSENIYSRGPLYLMYTAMEFIFMIDSLFLFYENKRTGYLFNFFPVLQLALPVIVGVAVQSTIYGLSVIWPSIVISLCSALNGLRNEDFYFDMLTGLYNRMYLNIVQKNVGKKKSYIKTLMMLDMNGFKSINDTYGHAEGDVALINTAEILKNTIGPLGNVVRYAGDEFIIILNTDKQDIADGCVLAIRENFENYNKTSNKEYKLSLSIGYCVVNMKQQNFDESIKKVDDLMYKEKEQYYRSIGIILE